MKPFKVFKALNFAVVIIAVIASFLIYPLLPGTVPTHWNALGEADATGPAWFGAFLFPLMMSLVLLLFVAIPKIVVFKKNFKAFEKQYWILALVIQVFFLLFYAVTLLPSFGYACSLSLLFSLPLSFMFIAIGLLMPSFKRNFFVGIRTPWSLANDKVWKSTHEFGGKLFVAAGVISLIAAFVPNNSILSVVAPVLIAAIGAVAFSFLEFRKSGKVKL